MHLYRLSEQEHRHLNIVLEKFLLGECAMSSVNEALMYKSGIEHIKNALSKECSSEFVLKEKVDTLPEAEAMVEKLQKEKGKK